MAAAYQTPSSLTLGWEFNLTVKGYIFILFKMNRFAAVSHLDSRSHQLNLCSEIIYCEKSSIVISCASACSAHDFEEETSKVIG